MSKQNGPPAPDEELDEILATYLDARQKGHSEGPDELIRRYPQFRAALLDHFENETAIGVDPAPGADKYPFFGDDYEVEREIGRSMDVVYKAWQKSLKKTVAIKTFQPGPDGAIRDVERIQREARRAAGLRHPQIVTVHQVAEYKGLHFFVMDYIDGENLADRLKGGPLTPGQAAEYAENLAEAVHYAHQRGILHSDLKPANVLLDGAEKPLISDFGLAKRLGADATYLPSSGVGGTAGYMSPEQSLETELTTATDVYGVGAVLYSMLTGHPPFLAKTARETLQRLRTDPPVAPSQRNPAVDPDLESICLKCLNKDPLDRYLSADALASDLERYRGGRETAARPWAKRERISRWCRSNPAVTGLVAAVVTIAALTVVMSLLVAEARQRALLEEALRSNAFAARDISKTALLQLQDLSDAVEVAITNGELPRLMREGSALELQTQAAKLCNVKPESFASCFILNAAGSMLARSQPGDAASDELVGEVFHWRDYFHGAGAHGGPRTRGSVHISSVYKGRSDDLYKFAISAPVVDTDGTLLGVVATSVTTDATMGLVDLDDPKREVVLIAPRDISAAGLSADTESTPYVVLFHPAYGHGVPAVDFSDPGRIVGPVRRTHARELENPRLQLPPLDDYQDPLQSQVAGYAGRWIAGFAPVGETGFVVVVQQRYEDVQRLDPSVSRNLVIGSSLAIGLALMILVGVVWRWRHRERPIAT